MYQLQDFIQLLLFFFLGTSFHSLSYAVLKMLFQNLLLYPCKGTFDSIYLAQNVDTVFTAFNHPLNAANLSFDSSQGNQVIFVTRILLHLSFLL
jgi:hypothetical protein